MPYFRKNKKKTSSRAAATTKKRYVKRKLKAVPTYKKMSGPIRSYDRMDPFKPYYNCRLHYTTSGTYTTNSTNTFIADHIFRLNSLYDPDLTFTGHQPYGFDQMALLYRNYKVNGVLIKATVNNPSQDGVVAGFMVGPPGATANLTGKSLAEIKERPMCHTRQINDSGSQRYLFKQYIPIQSVSGLTPLQFKANADEFTALTNANPTKTPFFFVSVLNNIDTTAANVTITITFTYYCTFFERIVQTQS